MNKPVWLQEYLDHGFGILIAILVTADNNGICVGDVLASLGLTGLVLALAAQETLSSFLGSIVILTDSPFFVDERVKIDTFEGTVEHVGIRSTRLQAADGNIITIPNQTVAGTSVINYSQTAHQLTTRQ